MSVLALISILLLLCFVVATVSMTDLSVASAYRVHVQNEQLARAAIAQFTYEADKSHVRLGPLKRATPVDWQKRYKDSPFFPDGASHLLGEVKVTFDPSLPHFSVDNSDSSEPAAGWVDKNTSTRSVPPYGVSLLLEVRTGRETDYFEAIVQRRWPYVLTAPGPVRILGTVGSNQASTLEGGIYCLNDVLKIPNTGIDFLRPPLLSDQLVQFLSRLKGPVAASNQVVVGGEITDGTLVQNSINNRLTSNVDFVAAQRDPWGVQVSEQNSWAGQSRFAVGSAPDVKKLAEALEMPVAREEGFSLINPPGCRDVDAVDPANPSQTVPFLLMEENLVIGARGNSGQPFAYAPGRRVLIDKSFGNSYLAIDARVDPPLLTQYGAGKTLEINNCAVYVNGDLSLGNGANSEPGPPDVGPAESGGLQSSDLGDLAVSSFGPPVAVQATTLKGSNATLFVNGTLSLSESSFDAQNQGMVILCRYLVCQATGYFRGLIMVQSGATFYPRADVGLAPLQIHGALVVGGRGVFPTHQSAIPAPPTPWSVSSSGQSPSSSTAIAPLKAVAAGLYQNGGLSPQQIEATLHKWAAMQAASAKSLSPGMTLWSSQLHYEPRHLRTLNGLGYFELISLRRLP